jgi:hypothetical protein
MAERRTLPGRAGRKEVTDQNADRSLRRRLSPARAFPCDSLNVTPRNADIGQFTVIQAVQFAKIFIVSAPPPKHSNQASDEIHRSAPLRDKIDHWSYRRRPFIAMQLFTFCIGRAAAKRARSCRIRVACVRPLRRYDLPRDSRTEEAEIVCFQTFGKRKWRAPKPMPPYNCVSAPLACCNIHMLDNNPNRRGGRFRHISIKDFGRKDAQWIFAYIPTVQYSARPIPGCSRVFRGDSVDVREPPRRTEGRPFVTQQDEEIRRLFL